MALMLLAAGVQAQKMKSPNGLLSVEKVGSGYEVKYQDKKVLDLSSVGFATTKKNEGLAFQRMEKGGKVKADYQMLAGKRLHCVNEANEYVLHYQYADGSPMRLVMRLYNDGLAFRYELEGLYDERVKEELTTYSIADGVRRWFRRFLPFDDKRRRAQQALGLSCAAGAC